MTNHGDLDTNRKQRPGDSRVRRVSKVLDSFELGIVLVLVALMSLVVLFASIDLAWTIVRDLLAPPFLLMTLEGLLDTFGAFLLVLIGLELLESIKAYLEEHVVHAEVVILAALIAMARKVIVLDFKELEPMMALGIATLIAALAAGYYLMKRAGAAPRSSLLD